ncbi:MAG: cysteine--tRNA ligase [Candidatus Goldiibacteriota bacterium]
MIRIFNTMTGKTEEFRPIEDGRVKMYVCGPTVYNYFHIGNARPFVVFDTVRSYLKYKGYEVVFAQNVTDIDDKLINKAKEEGVAWSEIAEKYTAAYKEDTARLKIDPPDINPRATEEIKEMIELIKNLEEKGYAYKTGNGVYFSVEKSENYGKLSGKNTEELKEGARVEVDEGKRSPLDFALWKFSKPGEPSWDSPWGGGRPGWHIECSAMSSKYLGKVFDIHGGGADLIFPHHENEIAQSEAAHGSTFVKYWMHNGYMNIEGEKMSKSKGNFVLVRDILKEYPAEIVRLFILSAHYRGPLDFSRENIEKVKKGYSEIYYTFQRIRRLKEQKDVLSARADKDESAAAGYLEQFEKAMDMDFNTAKAAGVLYKCIRGLKSKIGVWGRKNIEEYERVITIMCSILKIEPEIKPVDNDILHLVKQLSDFRAVKDFKKADEVRDAILKKGFMPEFYKDTTLVIRTMESAG